MKEALVSPRTRSLLIALNWSDEARAAALEARKQKSQQKGSSVVGKVGKGALIAGGALLGGALGVRTLPRMLGRGRVLQAGESLMGKVVYASQGKTRISDIVRIKGRTLDSHLRKAARGKGSKAKIAKALQKVDEFFGVPQRHYGVGVGSGRVADYTKTHGQRIIPQDKFGKDIRVVSEGKLLKGKKGPVGRELESKLIDMDEVEKLEARMGKMKDWRARDLCILGSKNCESYARGIGEGRKVSHQVRAMKAGAAGGASAGAALTSLGLGVRKKRSEVTSNEISRVLQVINWSDEARRKSAEKRKMSATKKGAIIGASLGAGQNLAATYAIRKVLGSPTARDMGIFIGKAKPKKIAAGALAAGALWGLAGAGIGKLVDRRRKKRESVNNILQVINGGPGSGHHGHKGIPGHRGGSLADGVSPATVALARTISGGSSGGVSESPQAAARRIKNVVTKTSKMADLYDSYAQDLEAVNRKRWMPLKTDDLAKLRDAHAKAAKLLYDSADQATLVKAFSKDEQKARLKKADEHADKASTYHRKLQGKSSRSSFTRELGRAFVQGALGGSLEEAAMRTGEKVGGAAGDIAMEGIRGGFKEAMAQRGRTVKEKKAEAYVPKSELDAAKWLVDRKAGEIEQERSAVDDYEKKGWEQAAYFSGKKPKAAESYEHSVKMRKPVQRFSDEDLAGMSTEPRYKEIERKARVSEMLSAIGGAAKKASTEKAGKYAEKLKTGGRDLDRETFLRMQKEDRESLLGIRALIDKEMRGRGYRVTSVKGDRAARAGRSQATTSGDKEYDLILEELMNKAKAPIGNKLTVNFTTVTANLTSGVRRETLQGREYLVAPLTMIVPGVLAGSKGPLYYPEDEVKKNPTAWNGMPIVVNHPMVNGVPVEARSPGVLDKQQIGTVFNARYKGKLVAEGWFDVDRTRKTNVGIYEQLINNKPIELSTGLYTDNEPYRGVWNGREYHYVARNYRPDHLAILLGSRGACSIKDGCGVLINKCGGKKSKKSLKLIRNKLVHPRVKSITEFMLNAKPEKFRRTKQVGGAVGGFGAGLAGTAAGAKAGGLIGTALAPVTGGLSVPVGAAIGGIAGGATGAWGGGRVARKVGGQTAGQAADLGGLAGTIASPGGVVRGAGRLIGRGGAKVAAKPIVAQVVRSASPRAVRLAKAKRLAIGTGKIAGGVGVYEGTTAGLDAAERRLTRKPVRNALVPRMGVQVGTRGFRGMMEQLGKVRKPRIRKPVMNWTEEARRKSAETRKRKAMLKNFEGVDDTHKPYTGMRSPLAAVAVGAAAGTGSRIGGESVMRGINKLSGKIGDLASKAKAPVESFDLPFEELVRKAKDAKPIVKKGLRSSVAKLLGRIGQKIIFKR